jgi:hypothetical protein
VQRSATRKFINPVKNYKDNIILIGPLAGLCDQPVDKLKWHYWYQNGYNLSESNGIFPSQGFEGLINHAQQDFGAKEIKRLLRKFKGISRFDASDGSVALICSKDKET